jgi:hypothetical protein
VSHTGLQRWIDAGDVPLVITREGKQEVAVDTLVELFEAARAAREEGGRRLHVLEPALVAGRARAGALDPTKLAPPSAGDDHAHDRAERRNRAYHAALARGLRRATVQKALHQLWRWSEEGNIDPRYAAEWEDVLQRPLPEIKRLLVDDSQRARDLRQNSPFAGLLSEPERRKILEAIR